MANKRKRITIKKAVIQSKINQVLYDSKISLSEVIRKALKSISINPLLDIGSDVAITGNKDDTVVHDIICLLTGMTWTGLKDWYSVTRLDKNGDSFFEYTRALGLFDKVKVYQTATKSDYNKAYCKIVPLISVFRLLKIIECLKNTLKGDLRSIRFSAYMSGHDIGATTHVYGNAFDIAGFNFRKNDFPTYIDSSSLAYNLTFASLCETFLRGVKYDVTSSNYDKPSAFTNSHGVVSFLSPYTMFATDLGLEHITAVNGTFSTGLCQQHNNHIHLQVGKPQDDIISSRGFNELYEKWCVSLAGNNYILSTYDIENIYRLIFEEAL